jgi:hypothetical protein
VRINRLAGRWPVCRVAADIRMIDCFSPESEMP